MITDENAQKLIVIATIITLGSTGMAYLKQPAGKLPIRPKRALFGGFAAMFTCAVIADFDPKLGVSLAWLVAGGAFINYGLPVTKSYYQPEPSPKQKQEEITKQRKGVR